MTTSLSPAQRVGIVGPMLFGSGMCALVYQTVWMRQFRLVFGGSTSASAAVLAVFMAGLGFGGIYLGRKAERSANPLRFYGLLEAGLAVAVALTPGLIEIINRFYLLLGGSATLGWAGAAAIRLLLTAFALLIPTLIMGGTLPAAVRAVETDEDGGRHRTAILYGANTLGAVAGVLITTFFALEIFGNRLTLWLACIINLLVAAAALLIASRAPQSAPGDEAVAAPPAVAVAERGGFRLFVLVAAAIVGFAFLLMELVWYRMLTPLLGGTLFSFGLILAAALLGIGIGGFVYTWFPRRQNATLSLFAATCALEALFLVIPFALGDRIAVFAVLLRSLGAVGFAGFAMGWAAVAMIVVFPASVIAGIQFPALIALLGSGREGVAEDVGQVYAWNTGGAILGSIAGGFGLLPLLSATGSWKLVIVLLCLISAAALFLDARTRFIPSRTLLPAAAIVAAVVMLGAEGPTAAWRHSPIGAGRADQFGQPRNALIDWLHYQRRILQWEKDGLESSVAMISDQGYAFVVNGKIDGHARFDGGTQIMSGLLGAILHKDPRTALVVGLGTGSTAGWLGAVPAMERVDVVELEQATIRVAEQCTPVNQNVLKNPKVHLTIGDGREVLLTAKRTYDLIVSEPSNPYRAGIASLYTTEFYRIVARKLNKGGLFLQWMQAYEIDTPTLRTVFGTFRHTFPYVETWETQSGDLLLIGSFEPISYDTDRLRARIAQEPYRSALARVWRVIDLEGVLAHYVAGPSTAELMASNATRNTDDRMIVEFAFARTLGLAGRLNINDLKSVAKIRRDDFPTIERGAMDLEAVERRRLSMLLTANDAPFSHPFLTPQMVARGDTHMAYLRGAYPQVVAAWTSQTIGPEDPPENLTFGESLADQGSESAMVFIDALRKTSPIEADVTLARLRWKQQRLEEAADLLIRAFTAYRTDPWPSRVVVTRALEMATSISRQDTSGRIARRLYAALEVPFVLTLMNQKRGEALALIAEAIEPGAQCGDYSMKALQWFEPHVPWRREFLARRLQCYAQLKDPRLHQAQEDLLRFDAAESMPITAVLNEEPRR